MSDQILLTSQHFRIELRADFFLLEQIAKKIIWMPVTNVNAECSFTQKFM